MTDAGTHPSDDLAAFALGALEPGEEASVREHLEECERCRAELRWLEPAVDVLPASVPQIEPPRSLRRELMKTVRADARAERGGWWSRRAGWISFRARPALVIGAVALLGAGVAGFLAAEANRSPAVGTTIGVEASAVLQQRGDEATLNVAGLPTLDDEDVYQAWYREGSAVEPAVAFKVGEGGAAEAELEVPPGTDEVLVTQESEPDLPAPEGDVLLSASLS